MHRRTARTLLIATAVGTAAAAAWWTRDAWLPHAGPWAGQAWQHLHRLAPDMVPPGPAPQAQPARGPASASAPAVTPAAPPLRKCVQDGRTTYTDQPCPASAQERPVDGAVTSLPRAP